MEGANIGFSHNGTDFWNYFGANFIHMGFIDAVNTLNGQDDTITEGLTYTYAGGSNAHYRLDEIGADDGVLYLADENEKGRGVYNIGDIYRTICCSPIIGAYSNSFGLNLREYLMGQYIDFLRGELVDLEDTQLPPATAQLGQNYPNPFNPQTTIQYYLPEDSHVSLAVYNLKGERINTLTDATVIAGSHNVIWNGKDFNGNNVASGIYLYKLESNKTTLVKKMILLK